MAYGINLVADKVDLEKANEYLAAAKSEFGAEINTMSKVFGVGLVLADCTFELPEGSFLEDMSKDNFIRLLTSTKFVRVGGAPLPPGKTIAVHNHSLKLHCFVRVLEIGLNFVYYHINDRDDANLDIYLVVFDQDEGMVRTVTRLLGHRDHDVAAMGAAMGMDLDTEGEVMKVLVPGHHPASRI